MRCVERFKQWFVGLVRRKWQWDSRLRAEAKNFDLRWARWGLFLLALCQLTYLSLSVINVVGANLVILQILSCLLGSVLILYFAHLLLYRLQCSLFEYLMLVSLIGGLAGSFIRLPGILRNLQLAIPLLTLVVAWGLYASMIALVQARLLGVESHFKRGAMLPLGWLASSSPVLLMGACTLWYLKDTDNGAWVSMNMAEWIVPLAVCGMTGLVLRVILSFQAVRAAKKILSIQSACPDDKQPSSGPSS